jgi:hypothetical protein
VEIRDKKRKKRRKHRHKAKNARFYTDLMARKMRVFLIT